MKFRVTGISVTGEWTQADWYDLYQTLSGFEERCAIRHDEHFTSHQADIIHGKKISEDLKKKLRRDR